MEKVKEKIRINNNSTIIRFVVVVFIFSIIFLVAIGNAYNSELEKNIDLTRQLGIAQAAKQVAIDEEILRSKENDLGRMQLVKLEAQRKQLEEEVSSVNDEINKMK